MWGNPKHEKPQLTKQMYQALRGLALSHRYLTELLSAMSVPWAFKFWFFLHLKFRCYETGETCYTEGNEPVLLLYSPSGSVPWALATCPSSCIKPWKQSLQSKCWQGRSQAPAYCRSCWHNEQVSTLASICPLLCFRSTSGSSIKLTPISMPMPVPETGAFPSISSGVKQRVERASSTSCEWSTKQSDCPWSSSSVG